MLKKDKIFLILNSQETGYIYGLSEMGNIYKIDPVVKKTWELVQYSPYIQEVKEDGNKKRS